DRAATDQLQERDRRRRHEQLAARPALQQRVGGVPLPGGQLAGPNLGGLRRRQGGEEERRVEAQRRERRRHERAGVRHVVNVEPEALPRQDVAQGEAVSEQLGAEARQFRVGGGEGGVGGGGPEGGRRL